MELAGFHWLEWLAFIASILYTLLAAKSNIWCWWFGFLGAAFTLILCIQVRLFSESLLQVFYMAMAIYGWYTWKSLDRRQLKLPILQMHITHHLKVILAGVLLAIVMGYFFSHFGAALPYLDAFTTGFSFIATWLIAWRYLQNWLYWIAIDAVSIYIYVDRGLYLLAILFVVYTLLAIYGFYKWKKELTIETNHLHL